MYLQRPTVVTWDNLLDARQNEGEAEEEEEKDSDIEKEPNDQE